MSQKFAQFAVANATADALTYLVPAEYNLTLGSLCLLPMRGRLCVGVFLDWVPEPTFKCVQIKGLLPYSKPFPQPLMRLIQWVSQYYLTPLGPCLSVAAPKFVWNSAAIEQRQKRFEKYIGVDNSNSPNLPSKILAEKKSEKTPQKNAKELKVTTLRPEQQKACELILMSPSNSVTLLQGVTGSGKTEVYLNIAEKTIQSGRSVLVLVPEIALTPQMSGRFRKHFGSALAVMHSGLTSTEYEREWFRILLGQAQVVLGVRTAIYAPLQNIGLIIVDEEHDSSYKNDERPSTHSRDVAVKRGQLENARCVLGSATPSLESYANVHANRYQHVQLLARHSGHWPEFSIVNAKESLQVSQTQLTKARRLSSVTFQENVLTPEVIKAIQASHDGGGQSMIILNRRGYAHFGMCRNCGEALKCPHCAVTTTLHKFGRQEICHYCGFTRARPDACPECGQESIEARGAGTQNIEAEVQRCFPQLRVARLDRDVLTSNTRLTEVIESFRSGQTDCLVGTQILAKGHDFPRVTLVVVLHVEDGLQLPDFRSSERTFALLSQAAGRAGRGSTAGKVILQSLLPEHPVIQFALQNDVDGFLSRELSLRTLGWHPPLSRLILFEFSDISESKALHLGENLRARLVEFWKQSGFLPEDVRICGPYPAALEKLRNEYRFQMTIAAARNLMPGRLVPKEILAHKDFVNKIKIDVDPHSFM